MEEHCCLKSKHVNLSPISPHLNHFIPPCLDVKFGPVRSSSPAPTLSTPADTSWPCSTSTATAAARTQPTPWWSGASSVCARPPGSPAEALKLNTTSARWASWSTAWRPSRGCRPGCLRAAWVWFWVKWCRGSCTSCTTPGREGDALKRWASPWWRWDWYGWRRSTTVMEGRSRSCS